MVLPLKHLIFSGLIAISTFFPDNLYCQKVKGSHWQIVKVDSSVINVKRMDTVIKDTLVIFIAGNARRIPVDSINSIIRVRKGVAGRGVGIGAAAGFVFGASVFFISELTTGEPAYFGTGTDELFAGIILAIPGAIIGGIVAAIPSDEKIYPMDLLSREEKSQLIRRHCVHN
jgi:hypothetical protein